MKTDWSELVTPISFLNIIFQLYCVRKTGKCKVPDFHVGN